MLQIQYDRSKWKNLIADYKRLSEASRPSAVNARMVESLSKSLPGAQIERGGDSLIVKMNSPRPGSLGRGLNSGKDGDKTNKVLGALNKFMDKEKVDISKAVGL